MQAITQEDIMQAFAVDDRDLVEPPRLEGVAFDDLDYFSWKHESGKRGYMVVPWRGKLVGLVLRLIDSASGRRPGMCQLCYGVQPDGGTTMVMIDTFYKPRTSHGVHVCRDLNCSEVVRGIKKANGMRETISAGQKIERLQAQLDRFVAGLSEKN